MKHYHGWREASEAGPGVVKVTEEWGIHRPLNPRLDLANKSPDGFQWGYAGSGPAQLALALIADATGDDALALRTYQLFKERFVAIWGQTWTITDAVVTRRAKLIDAEREPPQYTADGEETAPGWPK